MNASEEIKKKALSSKSSLSNANRYKQIGNKFFYGKLFEEALKCYDKAIELNPGEPCYFTNRALSNIQLHRWSQVVADCRSALEIDPYQIKAYVFMGHAFLEMKRFDEAIATLRKADQLVSRQKHYSNEEVVGLLRLARKGCQASHEEREISSLLDLKQLLRGLLRQKIEILKNKTEQDVYNSENKKLEDNETIDMGEQGSGDKKSGDDQELIGKYQHLEMEMNKLFDQGIAQRQNRDVMDALCGKISFELMRDPVTTPAGITYDRCDIEEHLLRVGHFDPLSREELTPERLTPNNSLRNFIDKYIRENPWAEFC